jgi:RNA polymerase subunit RPABC4/transcription elongation factor Spt4
MRVCSSCKQEFTDHEEVCPGCGSKYSEASYGNTDNWIHLTTVANEIEFELVAGLLETGGIPATMRSIGVDRYVGIPMAGIEVRVPAEKHAEALQIINAEMDETMLEEEELSTENEETQEMDNEEKDIEE